MHANKPKMAKKWEKEKGMKEHNKEGKMAKYDAKEIAQDAIAVFKMVGEDTDLPEWLEAKVTKAADYMNGVKDYLTHHQSGVNEDNGGIHSGKTCDQVHPKISHGEWENKLKTESLIKRIIKEELLKKLINEDDDDRGTYGFETGVAGDIGSDAEDANIDLYRKSVKALNLWVAEKGRPSQRTWRGGHPNKKGHQIIANHILEKL